MGGGGGSGRAKGVSIFLEEGESLGRGSFWGERGGSFRRVGFFWV